MTKHLDQPPTNTQRQWSNWVVTSFTPSGVEKARTSSVVGNTQELTSEVSSFPSAPTQIQIVIQQYTGQKFVDQQFPPSSQSIIGFGEQHSRLNLGSTTWESAAVFTQGQFSVAGYNVNPLDVKQGGLGDCYFIAAIAAVAEIPERARKLIISKDFPNSSGVHCVTLCITGVWEEIILDDIFPVEGTRAAFSQSKSNDLWVLLLEKAWAKVNGGYLNIESGLICEGLIAMTGAPCCAYFTEANQSESNWNLIMEAEKRNYIMLASSKNMRNGSDARDTTTGLSGSHAYSLLSAATVYNYGQSVRLVKLRNPWGKGEWVGAWSDQSPNWTPELRAQLQVSTADDGIFWMAWEDFQQYFNDFEVCFCEDSYQRSSKKYSSSPNTPTIVQFEINTPGEYYFMLDQMNTRMFRKSDNYVYSNLSMIVAKLEGTSAKFMGSVNKAEEQLWFKANCQPGSYVAYIETPWKRNVNTFTFSTYGPALLQLQNGDPNYFGNGFLEAVMIQKAKQDTAGMSDYSVNAWFKFLEIINDYSRGT